MPRLEELGLRTDQPPASGRTPGRGADARVESLPGIVWEADADAQRMTYVSSTAHELAGHDPDEWRTEPGFWEHHIHPDDLATASIAMEDALVAGTLVRVEYRFRTGDGTYRWFQDSIRLVTDETGGRHLVGVMIDTTDDHRGNDPVAIARAREATGSAPDPILGSHLHKMVVDNLADGVFYTDTERRITYWNHGAERLTGFPASAALNRPCYQDVLCHVDAQGVSQCGTCPLSTAISKGWERQQLLWLRHAAGHRVPVLVRAMPIHDRSGARVVGAVQVFSPADLDARRRTDHEPAPAPDPYADPMTGLPDTRLVQTILAARKDDLDRHCLPFGLVLVDMDDYSRITAERGSEVAIAALRAVVATVRGALRAGDVLVRWSPTELAIAVAMTDIGGLDRLTDRLLRLVRTTSTRVPGGPPVQATVSIGGTLALRHEPLERLYQRAEAALAAARAGGHNRVVLLDPSPRLATASRVLGAPPARSPAAGGRAAPSD